MLVLLFSPPCATAARTDAVRKASVIGSISISGIGCSLPRGGPVTVVLDAVWTTRHPMGRNTEMPKRASPCNDSDPMLGIVQVLPVIAATAKGYVAELASLSITYSVGFW